MIASTYMFLVTGIFAGVSIFAHSSWNRSDSKALRMLGSMKLFLVLAVIVFIIFFLASVPIGIWVAGKAFGWAKAWTGFPAFWNPEMYTFTNADNVSFLVLLFWAIPFYLNRRTFMNTRGFYKLFGWSRWLMRKAARAPVPKLTHRELAFMYCLMGIFTYVIFAVQPHG
jgi:hypothetical protein